MLHESNFFLMGEQIWKVTFILRAPFDYMGTRGIHVSSVFAPRNLRSKGSPRQPKMHPQRCEGDPQAILGKHNSLRVDRECLANLGIQ
jgi:hypothetical protein